jgi:hypothetical protein
MNFPKGTVWKAGNKYSYVISFMGGILKVMEEVLPWDYEASSVLQAETQSAIALWKGWDTATCTVEDGQIVRFKNAATPVCGCFRINSPTSCTYAISLTGTNADHFSITYDERGTTVGSGTGQIPPGSNIRFQISPTGSAESGDEANLVFTVTTTGGQTINIDSEVQRDGLFTIIL